TKDTIAIIDGTTYSFTVDTPEDQGLVSTKPAISQLLEEIISKDGSVQKYRMTDKDGIIKTGGEIVAGDRLIVISHDGKVSKTYNVALQPGALSGQLRL